MPGLDPGIQWTRGSSPRVTKTGEAGSAFWLGTLALAHQRREKIGVQLTLDLLEGHELTACDLNPSSLDRGDLLGGRFLAREFLDAQIPTQAVPRRAPSASTPA
jgi:hypothetical protein